MQIDWWTLGLQAVNFLVLVWLLWRFLYRPVRDVIEKRKALAEQAFGEADAKKQEAEEARQRFEDGQAQLAEERREVLKKVHDELTAERLEVLEEARQEAEQVAEAARKSIANEREAALGAVQDEVANLAVEIASELLRKASSKAPSGIFLEQLENQLKDLPVEERERLQKDLAADGARVTVVTADTLPPNAEQCWRERLNECLDLDDKTEFAVDPEIVGGAEIRFPHAVLKFTWADQLGKAKDKLREDQAAS